MSIGPANALSGVPQIYVAFPKQQELSCDTFLTRSLVVMGKWISRLSLTKAICAEQTEMVAVTAQRTQERDELAQREAFVAIYQELADPVYRYCRRRLGSRDLAEDATQQIFEKALRAYPRFDGRGSARAWIFSIAHNTLVDYYRCHHPTADIAELPFLPATTPSPEEEAITHERSEELHRLMNRLGPQERTLLELRLAGLNDHEIATVLGKSHGGVRTMQYRSIHRLRQMLDVESPRAGS